MRSGSTLSLESSSCPLGNSCAHQYQFQQLKICCVYKPVGMYSQFISYCSVVLDFFVSKPYRSIGSSFESRCWRISSLTQNSTLVHWSLLQPFDIQLASMGSVHELNRCGTWVVMTLLAISCLLAHHELLVHASDPDPLQDFCVADFSANAPHVNGYPCKLRANVTAADFLFTGLRNGPAGYGNRLPQMMDNSMSMCYISILLEVVDVFSNASLD